MQSCCWHRGRWGRHDTRGRNGDSIYIFMRLHPKMFPFKEQNCWYFSKKVLTMVTDILFSPVNFSNCWRFIFTARKRSLRRLCFYTCLSVILFTGGSESGEGAASTGVYIRGGGSASRGGVGSAYGGLHPEGSIYKGVCIGGDWADPSPIWYYEIWSMSGRYASYWNVFLFFMLSLVVLHTLKWNTFHGEI